MDVGSHEPLDPGPELAQRGDTPAAGIEDRDDTDERTSASAMAESSALRTRTLDGRFDAQPGAARESRGFGHPYQAVAVAASVIPSASSQRSASMAALQPSAAAVTAWR